MICARCIRARSALRLSSRGVSSPSISRSFSSTKHFREPAAAAAAPDSSSKPPPATSIRPSQPFSTPLSPHPSSVSLGESLRPKPKNIVIPVSSCPAGTKLKGLNYIKGRDDPLALPEEEYPEWLWRCLDVKVKEGEVEGDEGDAFSKSKKLRRKAAKRQRKLEQARLAAGDTSALEPKIPLTQQSIDLPANEEGTIEGALEAEEKRQELRAAMRQERRKAIKEKNFLKSM